MTREIPNHEHRESAKAVVRTRGGYVFLVDAAGQCNLPGGDIRRSKGETPLDALVREMGEELPFDCRISHIIAQRALLLCGTSRGGNPLTWHIFMAYAEVPDEVVWDDHASPENTGVKVLTAPQLCKLQPGRHIHPMARMAVEFTAANPIGLGWQTDLRLPKGLYVQQLPLDQRQGKAA